MRSQSEYDGENRRKRLYPQVSIGNVLAAITFVGSAVGVYTTLYADVGKQKIEIETLKINELKREQIEKDTRKELKDDIKEVKQDVKELTKAMERVLLEVQRSRR